MTKTIHINGVMIDFTTITRSKKNEWGYYVYRILNGKMEMASLVENELMKLKKINGLDSWYNKR